MLAVISVRPLLYMPLVSVKCLTEVLHYMMNVERPQAKGLMFHVSYIGQAGATWCYSVDSAKTNSFERDFVDKSPQKGAALSRARSRLCPQIAA